MRGELYSYDPRGNILKVSDITSAGSAYQQYSYSGDCLTAVSNIESGVIDETFSFCHDNLGRMTHDGLSSLQMAYNHMDLLTKVRRDSTILVNYSYLADGSKASSLKASGEGLVYRGPFTYRRSADGSLALESVVCAEGRLTPGKALLYVTDHLGSVRAVIDGNTGSALEASDYSAYGSRSDASLSGSSIATNITYRDHFTGQEDQMPDFGIPYSDHGARHYNPALRRWMTPDPLSEKYYGLSPYNYCGGNPVLFRDKNGEMPQVVIGAVVGAMVNTGIAICQQKSLEEVGVAAITGAIEGGIGAATFGLGGKVVSKVATRILVGAVKGAIGGAISSVVEQSAINGEIDSGQLSMDTAVGAASGAISSGVQHAFFSDAESKILSTEHRDAIWNQTKKSYRASGKSCSYQSISKSVNEQIVGEASAAQCAETTVCTAIGECSGQLTSVAIDEEY